MHLGYDATLSSDQREKLLVRWLKSIQPEAQCLYILGDLFDYWYEYKTVIPKGYIQLFAVLSEFVESGIEIHYLKGNHDLWHFGYLNQYIGLHLHDGPITISIDDKKMFLAHGDGLGKGDFGYKMIKSILTNSICQKIFSLIHPSIGLPLMKIMSQLSRDNHVSSNPIDSNQSQIDYSQSLYQQDKGVSFFIMGHRHAPIIHNLSDENCTYINLGDWITHFTYLVWDGSDMKLKQLDIKKAKEINR